MASRSKQVGGNPRARPLGGVPEPGGLGGSPWRGGLRTQAASRGPRRRVDTAVSGSASGAPGRDEEHVAGHPRRGIPTPGGNRRSRDRGNADRCQGLPLAGGHPLRGARRFASGGVRSRVKPRLRERAPEGARTAEGFTEGCSYEATCPTQDFFCVMLTAPSRSRGGRCSALGRPRPQDRENGRDGALCQNGDRPPSAGFIRHPKRPSMRLESFSCGFTPQATACARPCVVLLFCHARRLTCKRACL